MYSTKFNNQQKAPSQRRLKVAVICSDYSAFSTWKKVNAVPEKDYFPISRKGDSGHFTFDEKEETHRAKIDVGQEVFREVESRMRRKTKT